MAALADKIVEKYNYLFTDLADPRTNNFFLMSSPIPIVTLTGLYLYFSTSFGPRYMKDRQPHNLRSVVFVYNVCQVFMNTYLFTGGVQHMSSDKYSFNCELVDYSITPRGLNIAGICWWYFFSKVIDFLDTIFFVLRKKNDQISFLHVYHHSIMALVTWMGVKYFAGGQGLVMGTLNSFVHIVMYTYYLIAGLGPEYQKYIWWKKHVTILQLTQFVIIVIHSANGLFNGCKFPKILSVLLCLNALFFIYLFGKFFFKSYVKKRDNKIGAATNGTAKNGTATNGTAKNGTAKNGTATNGTAKNGTATNGTAKNGTATNGTATSTATNGINGHIHTKLADLIRNGAENIIANGKHKDD